MLARDHGAATPPRSQIAGFLIALRTKGETVEELAGLAATMRALATPVHDRRATTCSTPPGTGGGRPTFNVSTTAALIAAGAGCAVAKHGNRSATGPVRARPTCSRRSARASTSSPTPSRAASTSVGFGFMFAPAHHGATRFVVPVRKELAVRTIFNFLGPLTNPAGATRQLIGVSDPAYLETIAGALARLGCRPGAGSVQRRRPGRDEHVGAHPRRRGQRRRRSARYDVAPEDVGLERRAARRRRAAARPTTNAATTRRDLRRRATAPARDLAVLNAGAAIYAGGRADSLEEGVARRRGGDRRRRAAARARRASSRQTQELAPAA